MGDPNRGNGTDAASRRAGGHAVSIADAVVSLLPTPTVQTFASNRSASPGAAKRYSLHAINHLLPTPSVADSSGGHRNRSGARADELLLPGVTVDLSGRESWVTTEGRDYGPAVLRWAALSGNPIPPPTVLGVRGRPKLNPAFVEWMMGLPPGYVTEVPGLAHRDMLSLCGDGVVPSQAVAGLATMLRDLSAEWNRPA